ncbi:MAG: sigma-70 family RNA polymerase sigma factor [Gammaproteobacteria bacterium]|jgi:RNA polymerase sigma-70 factor (ECF subfamily)|nr:sigma-70 family RNA polymerase sigma factor [Gammaproteobacteria bacterium]MDP7419087.1 sigma-70 family RNA polymerase sigma factor [Gammaproteobacteria bacterium]
MNIQQSVLHVERNNFHVTVPKHACDNIIQFPRPARMELPQEEMAALLLQVASLRDRNAFLQLFRHFAPRIKSFLMSKGLSDQSADDILQEVMLAVWQKAVSYKPEKAAVSTWVFTIARNKYIDLLRRDERRKESSIESFTANSADHSGDAPDFQPEDREALTADDKVMQQQRASAVKQALSRLPEEQQAVIVLSFIQGLAHGEIAQHLDLPLGTVKSRIRLAFKHMRGELGEVL